MVNGGVESAIFILLYVGPSGMRQLLGLVTVVSSIPSKLTTQYCHHGPASPSGFCIYIGSGSSTADKVANLTSVDLLPSATGFAAARASETPGILIRPGHPPFYRLSQNNPAMPF